MLTSTVVRLASIFIHALLAAGTDTYDSACNANPLTTFDLTKMMNCGLNADAYAIWMPPTECPYCQRDSIDRSPKGEFTCYATNSNAGCIMTPYTYAPVNGKHYLERDIGNGKKARSLILDTDNCKYLVQVECYPDGSVWRYVTYKASWTQSEIDAFKKKVQKTSSLSFLRCLTFKCSEGKP
ncbi:uncharacterized protein LOC119440378 [Dermacentor silvarum]|uniref:uncharacterized protein LOC119440378 n=1 Tax=Dermacentor silvarum TaxID=543639 RepID=UPI0018994E06|nr:uncharacterized protein LOC119440378 [Dermacentor silvarum]